jgi:alkaline phosphatase D
MSRIFIISTLIILVSCKEKSGKSQESESDFILTFGSCNRTELPNTLWDDVLAAKPDVWIWGGDIVYADTDSIPVLEAAYRSQLSIPEYADLLRHVPVMGTWDDHDYGLNDGGAEFAARAESQQAFLDFIGADPSDPRRKQEGVYYSRRFEKGKGSVNVIVLDTRYHRSALIPDSTGQKRYVPNDDESSTMLGSEQWAWLESELRNSDADFNVIMSSIQVLSDRHGFETWGNMPSERSRLLNLIHQSGAKGVILLSGDRHISEFSSYTEEDWSFPVIDFTSSGLTHVYSGFTVEDNPYRVGKVVPKLAFGLIRFNFNTHRAHFEIVGDGPEILGTLQQDY